MTQILASFINLANYTYTWGRVLYSIAVNAVNEGEARIFPSLLPLLVKALLLLLLFPNLPIRSFISCKTQKVW